MAGRPLCASSTGGKRCFLNTSVKAADSGSQFWSAKVSAGVDAHSAGVHASNSTEPLIDAWLSLMKSRCGISCRSDAVAGVAEVCARWCKSGSGEKQVWVAPSGDRKELNADSASHSQTSSCYLVPLTPRTIQGITAGKRRIACWTCPVQPTLLSDVACWTHAARTFVSGEFDGGCSRFCTCCRFPGSFQAGPLWRRKSSAVCGTLTHVMAAASPSIPSDCAHDNTVITSTVRPYGGRFALLQHNYIHLYEFQHLKPHSVWFVCFCVSVNESHACNRPVDVPGPLKCVNSHPHNGGPSPWWCEGGLAWLPTSRALEAPVPALPCSWRVCAYVMCRTCN